MRFFILNWFGQKNPSELLNKHLKYFRFWLRIRRDIRIFVHSAHYQNTEIFLPRITYQNTEIFIPRIISIRTVKFSSNIYLIPRIIRIRKFSFRVLSEYGNFHSAYSQNTYRFIQRIRRMRPNNFEYSVLNYFHSSF
jgi:hypothetical protein